MEKKQRKGWVAYLYIFLGLAAIIVLSTFVNKMVVSCKRNQNSDEPTFAKMDSRQFADTYLKDSNSINQYVGKYIELEGVLLKLETNTNGESGYVRFLVGFQTDTAYYVSKKLMWPEIKKNGPKTVCDSLILWFGENYNLKEYLPEFTFQAEITNPESDTLLHYKYMPTCKLYERGSPNYALENFCAERVVVKARLDQIVHDDFGYTVHLDKGVLLSRKELKKIYQLEY